MRKEVIVLRPFSDATYMFFITSALFIALKNMCAKWRQCRKRDCVGITP